MANKDYGPKDYKGTGGQSLTSILAAKGITAKPGVSSGGNKATQRAADFKAGKTYTPQRSTVPIRGPVSPQTINGQAPALTRGGQPQPQGGGSRLFMPQGIGSVQPSNRPSAPMDFMRSAPPLSGGASAIGGGSFMPERAGLGPMLNDFGRSIGQSFAGERDPSMPTNPQGWPTGDQSRWGAQANRFGAEQGRAPDPISWIVNALWSMYGK